MNLGLGLGLGFNNQRGKPSPSSEDTVKTAIKERKHVRAVMGGEGVLIQPYALLNAASTRVLQCVVVAVEGAEFGGWDITEIDMASLSGVKVYDETFIPSDAFDGNNLNGVITVVEPFDPFHDTAEGGAGAE